MKILITLLLVLTGASTSLAAVKTWDGGGVDDNWRTAANWVNDVAPVSGDDLVFPAVAAKYTSSNNLTLFSTIRSMTFEGGTYTISGSPLLLSNGIVVTDGNQAINLVINLTAPQTFSATNSTAVGIVVAALLGSNTLTIDGAGGIGLGLISGSGRIVKNGGGGALISSASNYSGQITENQGVLIVDASIPSSTVTVNIIPAAATFDLSLFGLSDKSYDVFAPGEGISPGAGGLGGTGTVGAVNVVSGYISAGTLTSPTGILNTGNLNFAADGAFLAKLNGATAGENGYDQVNVTGTVSLNNAQLQILPSETTPPPIRRPLVILRNDGTDPVNGTFLNAPEGALILNAAGTMRFRINYGGGDGNDIILTRVRLPRV
ncbi:MAG: hypothetical protein IPI64_07390 [Chloracidobacterium sp.]|nr:hypothetical protein [Chloracidobacterium sp.]